MCRPSRHWWVGPYSREVVFICSEPQDREEAQTGEQQNLYDLADGIVCVVKASRQRVARDNHRAARTQNRQQPGSLGCDDGTTLRMRKAEPLP